MMVFMAADPYGHSTRSCFTTGLNGYPSYGIGSLVPRMSDELFILAAVLL